MRGGPSAVDLRDLEAAFARLSIRLEAAEARIALLEDQRNQARDYLSESPSGFSVVTAPPQRQAATSPPQVRTPAQEHPLQASAQPSAAPASRLTDRERQQLADHLGDWLRRELDGRGGEYPGVIVKASGPDCTCSCRILVGTASTPCKCTPACVTSGLISEVSRTLGRLSSWVSLQLGRQGERWLGPT